MRSVAGILLILGACSSGGPDASGENGSSRAGPSASAPDAPERATSAYFDERVRSTYDAAHDACSQDPDGVYGAAGSRSIHTAAEWYSISSRKGAHRAASYRGCADALRGDEKRF